MQNFPNYIRLEGEQMINIGGMRGGEWGGQE